MLTIDKPKKKRYKAGIKWLVGSAILAIASTGSLWAYGWWQNRALEAVAVKIIPVERGTIEETLNEGGTVELGNQQTLKAPGEAAVDRIFVKIGDRVTTGQPLLSLRDPEKQTSLAKSELDIQKAQLALENKRQRVTVAKENLGLAKEDLKEQVRLRQQRRQEILSRWELDIHKQELSLIRARQRVTEAQEKLLATKQELKNNEELSAKGFIAAQEVQGSREKVRSQEAELRQTQSDMKTQMADLEKLKIAPPERVESIDISKVQMAESDLQTAQFEVATALRELDTAKLNYQTTQKKLQDTSIVAPVNGKVLSLQVKAGDGIKFGDDLLTIGDPSQELVKLQLSTLKVGKVKLDQEARISIIGPNAKSFLGRVQSLYLLAISEANSAQSRRFGNQGSLATVPTTIQLNQPSGILIPGSQVNVEIVLQKRQQVVAVETELVQRSEPQPFVWVQDAEGKAQKRPVRLGVEGLTQIEVISGLKPGDRALLPPAEVSLQPGTPIKALKEETVKPTTPP